jgi:hypothetical protein
MSIVPLTDMQAIDQIVVSGDLSRLTPEQRVSYVHHVCQSLGLNPATRPFSFQQFQGRLVMYATKDCSEQLRQIHGVSVRITGRITDTEGGVYTVTVRGVDKEGRRDEASGSVSIAGLKGGDLANAMMKAETKAKRRLTLSICGLGFPDETEIGDGGPVMQPVRAVAADRLARLNALTAAGPASDGPVAAPVAPASADSEPPAPRAATGTEQVPDPVATDGGEESLEDLAEQVAALARNTGQKRTAMQALAAAQKKGKTPEGTRAVLEEWHEALSNHPDNSKEIRL